MGREVRRVPAGWQHPTKVCPHRGSGCRVVVGEGMSARYSVDGRCYVPLFDKSHRQEAEEYAEAKAKWEEGLVRDWTADGPAWKAREADDGTFEGAYGDPPRAEWCRPDWPTESMAWFQLYETVSEGTPLSPPMPDVDSLARWLAANRASAGPFSTMGYEQWLAFCKEGWAPSMVMNGRTGETMSGAEFVAATAEKKVH